ncbi:MAG: DEAD/DEAH box helicase family protein [Alphaproteobacteria bacterium]
MSEMNEAETCDELITPKLSEMGWGRQGSRLRRNYTIALGRLLGGERRDKRLFADYVLEYRGKMIGVVEAKPRDDEVTEGLAQAKEYAQRLNVRYTYSSNGRGIYQVDRETGEEGEINVWPSPDELWGMTYTEENPWRNKFGETPFEDKSGTWDIRYYQHIAIDRALEEIAAGQKRLLLTMATGTGKTAVAFQIAWKLFQQRWTLKKDSARQPRILFLTDRNILADQALNALNNFFTFPEGASVRIRPESLRKKGRPPMHASVYFTIFQTLMIGDDDNSEPCYKKYQSDFFDLVIIDECHRGGANDEGSWREIMEYFSPAVHLGLTATPKRKINADTYKYFGEPVYIYSLKEGINDGYLTPYRVRQYATSIDDYLYSPDDDVLTGDVQKDKTYTEHDFNRNIQIREREEYRVGLFMEKVDQTQKTLVFCATQAHALLVRDLINQIKGSRNEDYCVRVTSDEGEIGDQFLRDFQDNEKTIPTILTTSRKLSTGVDARNVRNIVLMRPINTIIEFKQIIGRGTRLYNHKDYFTVHDFVEAYKHFKDPEWDGEPLPPPDPDDNGDNGNGDKPPGPVVPRPPRTKKEMLKIKLADEAVRSLRNISSTSFYGLDGTLMSVADFMQRLFGDIPKFFSNEDKLRELWSRPETRRQLLTELDERGYDIDQLMELMKFTTEKNSDIFDLLAYVAYNRVPKSRRERVDAFPDAALEVYEPKLRGFLNFVLDKYVEKGVEELDSGNLVDLVCTRYTSVTDAEKKLGNISSIKSAFEEFQAQLYRQ